MNDPIATHPDRAGMTVVMITRDRRREAQLAVRRLLDLPDGVDVIVVDNGSGDGGPDLRGFPAERVTAVELGENLGAAGRNVGARMASTRYVAFADDDSSWMPGSLDRAGRLLDAHRRVGLIAGAVLVGDERRLDPACVTMARSPLPTVPGLPGCPVLGFIACGSVVRREAFLGVGGFDADYGVGGEERPVAIALAMAGWSLTYVPECAAQHWPSAVRDRDRRRQIVVRNDLWSTWRYRRLRAAVAATAAVVAAARTDLAARAGLREAVGRAAPVLRQRAPVSLDLERQLRAIDRSARDAPPDEGKKARLRRFPRG